MKKYVTLFKLKLINFLSTTFKTILNRLTIENVTNNNNMKIQFLPAGCGDAIILRFNDSNEEKRLIVIDFGKERYKGQDRMLELLREEINNCGCIDLFVITHMDNDHIGGVVSLFKKKHKDITDNVKEWWLNHSLEIQQERDNVSGKINAVQEVDLKEYLVKQSKCPEKPILAGEIKNIGGVKIEVLSPDIDSYNSARKITLKEEKKRQQKIGAKIPDHGLNFGELKGKVFEKDGSPANRSSIAFVLNFGNVKGLFLADSHPDIIVNSLIKSGKNLENKLNLDFVKISHHGSRKNTSPELLELLQCSNFIISVNGTNGDRLPDKEALFRLIELGTKDNPINLFFTHDDQKLRSIFSNEEIKNPNYHFNLKFPIDILTYPFEL